MLTLLVASFVLQQQSSELDSNNLQNAQDDLPPRTDTSAFDKAPTPNSESEAVTWNGDGSFTRPSGEIVTLPKLDPNLPSDADIEILKNDTPTPATAPSAWKSRTSEVSVGITRARRYLQVPDDSGGSGPFHRTLTNSAYFGMTFKVRLPADTVANVFRKEALTGHPNYGDTCYVYAGGWSGTGNRKSQDDTVIDFGLQFSNQDRNWDVASLFYRTGYDNQGNKLPSKAYSFPLDIMPGHYVQITFVLVPQTYAESQGGGGTTVIRGVITDLGTDGHGHGTNLKPEFVHDFPVSNAALWNILGNNQYLKRMVSIGQIPSPPHDLPPNANPPASAYHEGTRLTYFKHLELIDNNLDDAVFRAKRSGSVVSLIPGAFIPIYTCPDWTNGTNNLGPIYNYYKQPHDATTNAHWTRQDVVKTTQQNAPAGSTYVNIDCWGNVGN